MPKQTIFGVSAAKYLLKEKRFLLIGGTGLFVVFTLFTSPLFSMIPFTRGLRQLVDDDDDNPYYLMQQASAQQENEGVTDEEANTTAEVDESRSTDESTPVPCEETTAGCPPSSPLPPPSSPTVEPTPQANATALPGENVTAVPQTNQTNQNGQYDVGEPGIEGFTVTLEPASRGAGIITGWDRDKTDKDGDVYLRG